MKCKLDVSDYLPVPAGSEGKNETGGADMQKKQDQLAEYLFHQGTNYRAYNYLGAHINKDGEYDFRVWAPNADAVYLAGDFNGWSEDTPMTRQQDGIWTASLNGDRFGPLSKYKYIVRRGDSRRFKSDPYAFFRRPKRKPRRCFTILTDTNGTTTNI